MLPKEVGRLYAAVANSKEATLESDRLEIELAELTRFHQSIYDSGVLNVEQKELFRKLRSGSRYDLGLTAPASGPPEVHLKITAPKGGVPPVTSGKRTILCPHCGKSFEVDR
ncbi:MAG TPA: hypothetical protein VGR92_04340 [Steroidobacteraceae bacterium]|nr:hypothetical protein [Steroidobacteraceae bacterium]